LDLYTKIDAGETLNPEEAAAEVEVPSRPDDPTAPSAQSAPWTQSSSNVSNGTATI
jgi:hypothetical protein